MASAMALAQNSTSAARAARRGGGPSGTTEAGSPAPDAAASTSAVEPSAPATPPPRRGAPLSGDETKAIVLIEGDSGRGSGFIAKMRDQFFIVTNQHVLSGNKQFSATGTDGTKYPTNGPMFAARGYDIAIIRIPEAKYFLEVVPDATTGPLADDPVTVPGNSGGAGVATQTHGKLVGVGPQLVEVDAKFIQGNSGSPIIHRPTGQVIGVATYAIRYKLDDLKKAANVREVRWFGYRLDNVKNWEAVNWQKYSQEGIQMRDAETLTDDLIGIILDTPDPIKHEELRDAYSLFRRNAREAIRRNNEDEYLRMVSRLVTQIRFVAAKDLRQMSEQPLYSYHAEKLKEQQAVRKKLDAAFNDIDRVFRNALNN